MADEPNRSEPDSGEPEHDPGRRLRSTGRQELIIAAVLGAGTGWLLVRACDALDAIAPRVPWTAPVLLVLLTVFIGALARHTHRRIQVQRKRLPAERAVSFLVLGKAAALAGALIGGGYLAYGLSFVSRFDADTPRERVIRSGIAAVGALGVCLSGLWLERSCRVPDDHDDDAESGSGDTPTA